MARINVREGREQEAGGGMLPGGTYLAEVRNDAKEKDSAKGDPYFAVTFKVAEGERAGEFLCNDAIMLGGKGFGIGMKKLRALGFDVDSKDDLEIEASDLIGRRARLTVAEQAYTKTDGSKGRSLKPTGDADSNFGYGMAVVGAPSPISEVADEECECGHGPKLHASGACSAAGCGCKAYASLPF